MTEPHKKPIADIGGKRAISLFPYIVIAPTTILSVVLIEPTEFTMNQVSGWLIASTVSYVLF